jgi:hypothetical protein
LHQAETKPDSVGVYCGTVAMIQLGEFGVSLAAYASASQREFPNAHLWVGRGHRATDVIGGNIYYCQECRDAERDWVSSNQCA